MTNEARIRRPMITAAEPVVEAAANAILPLVPATDARSVARSPRATLSTTTRSNAGPTVTAAGTRQAPFARTPCA